ncbi:hypothetical protein G9A89_011556 [Geosiphon pyriformis]|nr:hypothetical protein G9A89_011556 [Geosiphon pyriformis]
MVKFFTFQQQRTIYSRISLPIRINCRYVVANGRPDSGNVHHFNSTTLVWHPNSHMLSGTVHFKLPVAVRKRLYNKDYPGVSCLFCDDVELPDHGFTCVKDASVQSDILGDFNGIWINEAIASLSNKKKVAFVVVDFVRCLAESHRMNLWLFRTKFRSDIERSGLIGDDVFVASAFGVGALSLLVDTVRLTGVLDSLDVSFSFRDRFLFLSGAVHRISVSISV